MMDEQKPESHALVLRCTHCGREIDMDSEPVFVKQDDLNRVLCLWHGRGKEGYEFWALPKAYIDFRYGPEKFGMHRR